MKFNSQSCPMIHLWISLRAFVKRVFNGSNDLASDNAESLNMEENK